MQKKKEINIEVGHRIQLSRERAGYTQEQFAELIDAQEVIIKNGGHLNTDSGYTEFTELLKYV